MKLIDLDELSRELTQQRRAHAWVTVIAVRPPSSAYVGAQAVVEADGELHGWVGGGCVQGTARAVAMQAIADAAPRRVRLSNDGEIRDGVDVVPMQCVSNGEVEMFVQPKAVTPRLRIYGATPVARAAAWFARETDFDPITDAEAADMESVAEAFGQTQPKAALQRETYALIATQGDGDENALEHALRSDVQAVLLVASTRKTARLREAMMLRGIAEDRLAALHAPAGPDIGAVTPNEIALAAVAGLVALRHGRATKTIPARRESSPLSAPVRAARAYVAEAVGYVNPVCGAIVDPARAMSSLTMEGQTHYFCCQGCRTEFERDPAKYLAIGVRMRAPAVSAHE
ncbi:XdhC family protein [Rudaea sp.]|uniref:XdhC family protein n=1 Tax=Rudaea sp. TaxID=2136325 RepID=UPI002ED05DDD